MLAKWVLVAFLGFAAAFSTELRADRNDDFMKLLGSPTLTDSMKSNLAEIRSKIGTTVSVPKWLIERRATDVERTLSYLASREFAAQLETLRKSCKYSAFDAIELGSSYAIASTTLFLNVLDAKMAEHFIDVPKQCLAVDELLARMSAAVAPRAVEVEREEVASGRMTAARIEAWKDKLLDPKFLLLLKSFEERCRAPLSSVRLAERNSYSGEAKRLLIRTGDDPSSFETRLSSAAEECASAMPVIERFNTDAAVRNGVLFTLEAENFLIKRFSSEQILGWINFFKSDLSSLEQLRQLALRDARPAWYSQLRACLKNKAAVDCRKHVIAVDFGTYTGFVDYGVATLFHLFIGDLITATLSIHNSAVQGTRIMLDARQMPAIPGSIAR